MGLEARNCVDLWGFDLSSKIMVILVRSLISKISLGLLCVMDCYALYKFLVIELMGWNSNFTYL